jgi:hypothetical protein
MKVRSRCGMVRCSDAGGLQMVGRQDISVSDVRNRIGRRTIMCVPPIAALAITWNLFGR